MRVFRHLAGWLFSSPGRAKPLQVQVGFLLLSGSSGAAILQRMKSAGPQATAPTDRQTRGGRPRLLDRRLPAITYIVITAFVLRVAASLVVPHKDIWATAGELGNLARSLATGQGFSNPFAVPTGSTAWAPPLYPLLLATIFKVFGVFSHASMIVTFLFQITTSTLTCIPIFLLGAELGNEKLAEWAGWCWACYPYFVLLPALFVWDTTLDAFLLSWILLITLRLNRRPRLPWWGILGMVWAIAALDNPALLTVMPICLGWLLWQRRPGSATRLIAGSAILLLIFSLGIAPWCWRNWKVFGTFVPIRSSFGENLWLGNHAGGTGRSRYGEHANENPREMRRFQQLGEIAYIATRKEAAIAYIRNHPKQFLRKVTYRALYWWFALGESSAVFVFYAALGAITMGGLLLTLRAGRSDWFLIALTVVAFPLTYYLVDVLARYRHPVEPAMVLISINLIDYLARKVKHQSPQVVQ